MSVDAIYGGLFLAIATYIQSDICIMIIMLLLVVVITF